MVYKLGMDASSLVNNHLLNETEKTTRFDQVAFELGNIIKNMPIKNLSQKLQVEHVIEGECNIPTVLYEFMCNLIQGPGWQRQNSDHNI